MFEMAVLSSSTAPARVFASRDLPGRALDRLRDEVQLDVWDLERRPNPAELRARTASAKALISMPTDRVDDELLASCPDLLVVANMAVGYDNFDVEALTRRGIPAGNTPGVLTDATADLTLGLIIATARRFTEARELIETDRWGSWDPNGLLGLELRGATLGIVGLGRIGRAVAERARGFGMRVIGYTRNPITTDGVERVALDDLLARSDVVSLHVSLNAETTGLIGAREFALMKPSAILVNTTRGKVVDVAALIRALQERRIGAAGLDVFEVEPIGAKHPLLALDNCVVTPHLGSATTTSRNAMANLVVDNVLAALSGEPLPHCVNPEVYTQTGTRRP